MRWDGNLRAERPTFVSHLECSATGARYPADARHGLSDSGKPLLVRYDLDAAGQKLTRESLAARPADLWRWRELLPVRRREDIISLGEAATPLVRLPAMQRELGVAALIVKDEGRLPSGSFKARGIAVAVSMAKALGVRKIVLPTNGNAGAALAAYAARAGIEALIFCPADTPEINLREMGAHGALVERIDGLIDDCGALAAEAARDAGWFDMSTLKEPYRIEGKKTMGLELAEQLGWRLPDAIFYPTGGGTGLIGERPRMIAVQAEGCAPIVDAWERGDEHARRWEDASTVAAGIRVPRAIGDFLILRAVRESGGFAIAVADEEILGARDHAAKADGLLLCPEGAATLAACARAQRQGLIRRNDRVVLFNCASGLKYPLPELA